MGQTLSTSSVSQDTLHKVRLIEWPSNKEFLEIDFGDAIAFVSKESNNVDKEHSGGSRLASMSDREAQKLKFARDIHELMLMGNERVSSLRIALNNYIYMAESLSNELEADPLKSEGGQYIFRLAKHPHQRLRYFDEDQCRISKVVALEPQLSPSILIEKSSLLVHISKEYAEGQEIPILILPLERDDCILDLGKVNPLKRSDLGFRLPGASESFFVATDQRYNKMTIQSYMTRWSMEGQSEIVIRLIQSKETTRYILQPDVLVSPNTGLDAGVDVLDELRNVIAAVGSAKVEAVALSAGTSVLPETIVSVLENGVERINTATAIFSSTQEFFGKFNNFEVISSALEKVAELGGMAPLVGSAFKVVEMVANCARKMEQERSDVAYLHEKSQLVMSAIDNRMRAYFEEGSQMVIQDELCIASVKTSIIRTTQTLVKIFQHEGRFHSRGVTSRIFSNLVDAPSELEDLKQELDDVTFLLLLTDPAHFAVNLAVFASHFTDQSGSDFWTSHKLLTSVETEDLAQKIVQYPPLQLVIKRFLNDSSDQSDRITEIIEKEIDRNSDGFVHVREFADWTAKGLSKVVREALKASTSKLAVQQRNSIFQLKNWLKPVAFGSELKAILDSRLADGSGWLLDIVDEWVKPENTTIEPETSKSNLLILLAGAGFGKSTVSAAAIKHVGSFTDIMPLHFIFRCDEEQTRMTQHFICTIAFQLARANAFIRDYLVVHLENVLERKKILFGSTMLLVDMLVLRPIRLAYSTTAPFILFIDGFDECPDYWQLLFVMQQLVETKLIRIFVTGRPMRELENLIVSQHAEHICIPANGNIYSGFRSTGTRSELDVSPSLLSWMRLEDKEDLINIIIEEIREYAKLVLSSHGIGYTTSGVDALVKKSKGNFLWATMALEHIRQQKQRVVVNPLIARASEGNLDLLVSRMPSDLRGLYSIKLRELDSVPNSHKRVLQMALAIIGAAREPLAETSLIKFMESEAVEIRDIEYKSSQLSLRASSSRRRRVNGKYIVSSSSGLTSTPPSQMGKLEAGVVKESLCLAMSRSILRMDSQKRIYLGHKSIRDVLDDSAGAPNNSIFSEFFKISYGHRVLARVNLDILLNQLQPNPLQLDVSKSVSLSSISHIDEAIADKVGLELTYSTKHCIYHVKESFSSDVLHREGSGAGELHILANLVEEVFGSERILYWIESLAILRALELAKPSLLWIQGLESKRLKDAAMDVDRLLESYMGLISELPNELYRSAMSLTPVTAYWNSSKMSNNLDAGFILPKRENRWDAHLRTFGSWSGGKKGRVPSQSGSKADPKLAFTLGGEFVAYMESSRSSELRIWNTNFGQMTSQLKVPESFDQVADMTVVQQTYKSYIVVLRSLDGMVACTPIERDDWLFLNADGRWEEQIPAIPLKVSASHTCRHPDGDRDLLLLGDVHGHLLIFSPAMSGPPEVCFRCERHNTQVVDIRTCKSPMIERAILLSSCTVKNAVVSEVSFGEEDGNVCATGEDTFVTLIDTVVGVIPLGRGDQLSLLGVTKKGGLFRMQKDKQGRPTWRIVFKNGLLYVDLSRTCGDRAIFIAEDPLRAIIFDVSNPSHTVLDLGAKIKDVQIATGVVESDGTTCLLVANADGYILSSEIRADVVVKHQFESHNCDGIAGLVVTASYALPGQPRSLIFAERAERFTVWSDVDWESSGWSTVRAMTIIRDAAGEHYVIVSDNTSGRLRVIALNTGDQVAEWTTEKNWIGHLHSSSDKKVFLSTPWKDGLRLWNASDVNRPLIEDVINIGVDWSANLGSSSDLSVIITDGGAYFRNIRKFVPMNDLLLYGDSNASEVYPYSLSEDGRILVVGAGKKVDVYELNETQGQVDFKYGVSTEAAVTAFSIAKVEQTYLIAVGFSSGKVELWKVPTESPDSPLVREFEMPVVRVKIVVAITGGVVLAEHDAKSKGSGNSGRALTIWGFGRASWEHKVEDVLRWDVDEDYHGDEFISIAILHGLSSLGRFERLKINLHGTIGGRGEVSVVRSSIDFCLPSKYLLSMGQYFENERLILIKSPEPGYEHVVAFSCDNELIIAKLNPF
ncbi:hypothetical protein BJ742DRAFT_854525 [Cladochytrium replicatum]|nr:hypothetical protein BJ742DRAFT_854525 [Cladochytrium replicatum]